MKRIFVTCDCHKDNQKCVQTGFTFNAYDGQQGHGDLFFCRAHGAINVHGIAQLGKPCRDTENEYLGAFVQANNGFLRNIGGNRITVGQGSWDYIRLPWLEQYVVPDTKRQYLAVPEAPYTSVSGCKEHRNITTPLCLLCELALVAGSRDDLSGQLLQVKADHLLAKAELITSTATYKVQIDRLTQEAGKLTQQLAKLQVVLEESDKYLDTNYLTTIASGSILHQKMKKALEEIC